MMNEQSSTLATLFQQTWNTESESRPNIHDFLFLLKSALHEGERPSWHQKKSHSTTYKAGAEVKRERERALDATSLRAPSLESSPRIHTSSPGSPSSPKRFDDKITSRRISYKYTISALDNDSGVIAKPVWEVYNQRAAKIDTELVKDFNEFLVSYSPDL